MQGVLTVREAMQRAFAVGIENNEARDRKLANLAPLAADCIVSGNVGCIGQLQSGTATPVRHWIEILDDALSAHAEQQD